jgi:hypothetical protein
VRCIVSEFKIDINNSEFEAARGLALAAKKQGLNLSYLASNFRLHNFIRSSGENEDEIEIFITNVHLSNIPTGKLFEYVNQIHDIAKEESFPLDQISDFVKRKIEEMKKIEEEVREADTLLQNKNVRLEAIGEHIKLNEELNKHGLSTPDIDKLLNLLVNAKEYGFDSKLIVRKLRNITDTEQAVIQVQTKCILPQNCSLRRKP